MMTPESLRLVRAVPLFSGLTDAQSVCIEAGEVIEVPVGTVLASEGQRSAFFFVVLEGEIRLTRTYGGQSVLMGAIRAGSFSGETSLLLDIPWLATARVAKPTTLLRLCADDFWQMMCLCRTVAQEVFRSAANKVRNMEGYSHQREKLTSLGTMAAGLAHELNNPAAAARRAAAHLRETTDKAQGFLRNLTQILDPDRWRQLLSASDEALDRLEKTPALDHLEGSDRAEIIAAWLETHGMASAYELAPTFVKAGLDSAWLEEFIRLLPAATRGDALGWLEARLQLKSLLSQVEKSTGRIAELVKAVKSYSYMDQTPMQEVDVHEGIESTLTILAHQLKNIEVVRAFDRGAPRIQAYGSELNQVWTNLIDNAIHAVEGSGKICVRTCTEDNQLLVEIVDNGTGIPPEIQPHLFEPFFTTKPVGSGTGLGLVISNRIVADRHGGEIEFESQPGETRFKVRLPLTRRENFISPSETLQSSDAPRARQ